MFSPSPRGSPSSRSAHNSPQSVFRRTIKTSFSGSTSSRSSLPDSPEGDPLLTLRVQVIGCQNLPATDLNGKSDPYVAVSLGKNRHKTPVSKRTLNPKFPSKDATFEFPITAAHLEKRGAFLDIVVWDKDTIGKDLLAEVSLTPAQWFKRRGDIKGANALAFDDPNNNVISCQLITSKPRKARLNEPYIPPTIQLKLGFSSPLDREEMQRAFDETLAKSPEGEEVIFAAPPTQAVGAVNAARPRTSSRLSWNGSDGGLSNPSSPLPPSFSSRAHEVSRNSFRVNFEGTMLDYDFTENKDMAGLLLLEVVRAADLPRIRNAVRASWNMDPFIIITYAGTTYRTRVIRHNLNPLFQDKFVFAVKRAPLPEDDSSSTPLSPKIEAPTVSLKLMDWEAVGKDELIGSATLDLQELVDSAPKPDEETALYNEEAMRLHGFSEVELKLVLDPKKEKFEANGAHAVIVLRAKYDPHNAMRQRFWRSYLKEYDLDHSGQYSASELTQTLSSIDHTISPELMDAFFTSRGKDASKDELTIEEAVACLEAEFGARANQFSAPIRQRRLRKARSSMFGHSRDSIYELEEQLNAIIAQDPSAHYKTPEDKENGVAVVPAKAIPGILAKFSELHGINLLESEEEQSLKFLVETMQDAEIGTDFLIAFIAKATGTDVDASAVTDSTPSFNEAAMPPASSLPEHLDDFDRGRSPNLFSPEHQAPQSSRASSRDSVQTSYHVGPTRKGSVGVPQAPQTPQTPSIFDKRQRSTPLEATTPSSWNPRPVPAAKRRRSSVGSLGGRSDTEGSSAAPPVAYSGARVRRQHGPSNPASPIPPFIFPRGSSRPTSPMTPNFRSGSQSSSALPGSPRGAFHSLRLGASDPALPMSINQQLDSPAHEGYERNPFLAPRDGNEPSLGDDDDEDNRSESDFGADSGLLDPTASLYSTFMSQAAAEQDRIEALEKEIAEKTRKLNETQRTLESRTDAHETEIEELQIQRQELEDELGTIKKEEKELRVKDRNSMLQLAKLEAEVSRLQRAYDSAQESLHGLQKKYQEQLAESERYRDALRGKDNDLKAAERSLATSEADVAKWKHAAEAAQQQIDIISEELEHARAAVHELSDQKQENLSLKETIDRLRFDLDELRNANTMSQTNSTLNPSQTVQALSLELGDDLKAFYGPTSNDADEATVFGSEKTDEDEDYVETVITRRKKAAKKRGDAPRAEERVREFIDAQVQHDVDEFTSTVSMQTDLIEDPVLASIDIQTDEIVEPVRVTNEFAVQTEEEEIPVRQDASTSTDVTTSTDSDEFGTPGASSSSAAAVPNPPVDEPPSYGVLIEEERHQAGLLEVARWHPRLHSTAGVPDGVSSDALQEWARLKDTIGFSCLAIDQVLANSAVTGPRPKPQAERAASAKDWSLLLRYIGVIALLLVLASKLPPVFDSPSRLDRRMWDVYNDISGTGYLEGFSTPVDAGPSIRKIHGRARRAGWVPS